jgi:UDP-N-acetylmuramoyl-L-alanyl-D-glutamate--2,6-diaminopimelate ligase
MLSIIKKIIPKKIFSFFQPYYHISLSILGSIIYRFPSRKIKVIGITGTKGKTTTTEIVSSIFRAAGFKTASSSTVQFSIGEKTKRNNFKMTMPGRFFIQKFLRDAVDAGCEIAVLEMSSEGAKQFRHLFIELDALIFTNISPEHIESHGSYKKYIDAKLSIGKLLERKYKTNQAIIIAIALHTIVTHLKTRMEVAVPILTTICLFKSWFYQSILHKY